MTGKEPRVDGRQTQGPPPARSRGRFLHKRGIDRPRLKPTSQSSTSEEVRTQESVQQHTSFESGRIKEFVVNVRQMTSNEFTHSVVIGSEIPISDI